MKLFTILLFIFTLFGMSAETIFAKDENFKTFNTVSYTLMSIWKIDSEIFKRTGNSKIIERFMKYRGQVLQEGRKVSPMIPAVWSLHPSLDTTSLYEPYIQKYSLSCEIAAVKMVLQSFGTRRSEEAIFSHIPHFPGVLSGSIWGDPDTEFVGYLTGTQGGRTGYGIYAPPLAYYLEGLGYKVTTGNTDIVSLLEQIKIGSRVILWGDWCTTPSEEDGLLPSGGRWIRQFFPLSAKNICDRSSDERKFSWNTPGGKSISGISGEHTFLLLGAIGPLDNPTHIIVWDTYTGRHLFSITEWMRKWELLGYRSLEVRD